MQQADELFDVEYEYSVRHAELHAAPKTGTDPYLNSLAVVLSILLAGSSFFITSGGWKCPSRMSRYVLPVCKFCWSFQSWNR